MYYYAYDREDEECARRIYEGSIYPRLGTPGLSLHELRQIAALSKMGWLATAWRQFCDLWFDGRPI